MFPFIHMSEDGDGFQPCKLSATIKYLFFSSKGHTNLGGYDVFRSAINEDGFQTAFNLGNTLNSRKDEVAFIVLNDNKGYVSSDKTATDGNFDIFKYNLKLIFIFFNLK